MVWSDRFKRDTLKKAFRPGPASGLVSKADLAGPALYASARKGFRMIARNLARLSRSLDHVISRCKSSNYYFRLTRQRPVCCTRRFADSTILLVRELAENCLRLNSCSFALRTKMHWLVPAESCSYQSASSRMFSSLSHGSEGGLFLRKRETIYERDVPSLDTVRIGRNRTFFRDRVYGTL